MIIDCALEVGEFEPNFNIYLEFDSLFLMGCALMDRKYLVILHNYSQKAFFINKSDELKSLYFELVRLIQNNFVTTYGITNQTFFRFRGDRYYMSTFMLENGSISINDLGISPSIAGMLSTEEILTEILMVKPRIYNPSMFHPNYLNYGIDMVIPVNQLGDIRNYTIADKGKEPFFKEHKDLAEANAQISKLVEYLNKETKNA